MRVYTSPQAPQEPPPSGRTRWLIGLGLILVASCRDGAGVPEGGLQLTSLSLGQVHSCGMSADGFAYCWGGNQGGELGSSTGESAPTPEIVLVRPLSLKAIVAGGNFTCGVIQSGTVYCWGEGDPLPLRIENTASLDGLKVGAFACMLDSSDSAWCWSPGEESATQVTGGLTFTDLSVGFQSCGVTPQDETWCWDSPGGTPVLVGGGVPLVSVTVGGLHACGLDATGLAYCWGEGSSGQLGNFNNSDALTPVPVQNGIIFTGVSAGQAHTCGVTASGVAYCWGFGLSGQLGFGGNTPFSLSIPGQVSGQIGFSAIVAGGTHTCGFDTSQRAYCWGGNSLGSVGDGSLTDQLAPEPVAFQ